MSVPGPLAASGTGGRPLYGAIQRRGQIFPRLHRGLVVDLGAGSPTGVALLGLPDSECSPLSGPRRPEGEARPAWFPMHRCRMWMDFQGRLEEARMHRAADPPGAQKVLSQDSTRALARLTGLRCFPECWGLEGDCAWKEHSPH